MRVWRLITHHADKDHALFWSKQNSRIAIGWGPIGNIRVIGYGSADDITAAIRRRYPEQRNPHLGGSSLWDFYASMQKADFVILSASKPHVLVVQVGGDYEFEDHSPFEGDYQHQRSVVIRRDLSPKDLWKKAGGAAPGQNDRQTLIRYERALTEDDL